MTEHDEDIQTVPVEPLVDWDNPPTVEDLKQDLLDAKPNHDAHVSQVNTWLDNLHVTGKAKVNAPKGRSSIVPKLIRKQAEWRYAALTEPFLSTDDLFNVNPVTWEDRKAAQQNQLLLNHQINNKIDKVKFIDEYVRTAVDEGTVIVKVGWKTEEEEYETVEPQVQFTVNPEFGPIHEELAQLKVESPSEYATNVPQELKDAHDLTMEHGEPVEPVVIGEQTVTKTRLVRNHPTLEVCDFRNVIIDPSCQGVIEDAKFIIHSFETCLADLEKDTRYKNLDRIDLEANSILGEPDHAASEGTKTFNFSDTPRKKFVMYEYWGFWDINGDGVLVPIVASWVGSTLVRLEESPFPDKALPFVVEQYLPIRKSPHGEPDGSLLEDNQKVIGAVTRGMIDIMGRSANGQTGIRKDMLDVTNRRKFENGQDYEFNPQVDPRQGVFMHTYPEIPASAQFMIQLQNMEAESLTGVKSFHQGVSGQSLGDVAAGVRGALDAASKRELGILRRLSNGIIKIGRKFISMNAEFLSEEEVVRVTNEEFVVVRRDDLPGAFDLKLSISTAEEDQHKAEKLAFLLQTTGNTMDPELNKMILADISRLQKMPDLAKRIESYQPQPDPMQQRMAELQMALLEAQVRKEQALAIQAESTAMLNQAKVGTEQVKQGNLQSDTDLKNLDFVEQESGVKQERDIQKIGEQARSQAQLKLIERENNREKMQTDLLKEYIKNKKQKK
jgi:hypothetical protein